MKIKCLVPEADMSGSFDYGQIVDMPEATARAFLKRRTTDGSPKWVEVAPTACPHCGQDLEAPPLEAATVSHQPRRRG